MKIKVDETKIAYLKEIKKNGSFVIEKKYIDELDVIEETKEIVGSKYALLAFNRQVEITLLSIGVFDEPNSSNPYVMEYMTTFFSFKDDPKLNFLYTLSRSIEDGSSIREYMQGRVF